MPSGLQLGAVNTLVNAATVSGTSATFQVPVTPNVQRGGFIQTMTVQANATGAPTVSVQLMGSLDGANWTNIGSALATIGGAQAYNLASNPAAGPYAFLRVVYTITGGTSPTLTVLLALGAI